MPHTNRPAPQIVAFRHGLGRQIISGSTLSGGVKTGMFVPGGGSVYSNIPGSTSAASNAFILAPLAATRESGPDGSESTRIRPGSSRRVA